MIRPFINFKKEWILRLATLAQNDTSIGCTIQPEDCHTSVRYSSQ